LNDVATARKHLGQLEEAAANFRDLIARRKAAKQYTHFRTAIALNNLGVCLESLDRVYEAEHEFDAALTMLEKCRVPKRHWLTTVCRKRRAIVHTKQKRYPEAESTLQDCIAIFESTKGDQGMRIRKALETMAKLYDAWGKPKQAEQARARIARLASHYQD
jgi:tetratricopeptide (TPR) repeat protein